MANNKVSVQVIDGLEPILDKKADDSTVVHNTGDENIDGNKTFLKKIVILEDGGGTEGGEIILGASKANPYIDKDYMVHLDVDNKDHIRLFYFDKSKNPHFPLLVDTEHHKVQSITPPTVENSNVIATTKWVNDKKYAVDSNVVHKSGDEVISGSKEFTAARIRVQNVNYDITKNPSAKQYCHYSFLGAGRKEIGGVYMREDTDGTSNIHMFAVGRNDKRATLYNRVYANGTRQTLTDCEPSSNANDGQIATTRWINTKFQVVSALPAKPDSNVFYCIPE